MANISDRRAQLLEDVADSCRRELALEEAKKESAAEFNDQIKAIKVEREIFLKNLDMGADPQELPFTIETPYPMPEEDLDVVEPDPDDPGLTEDDAIEESEEEVDPGRFFE